MTKHLLKGTVLKTGSSVSFFCLHSRNRDTDAENSCVGIKGEEGGRDWEIGIDMYIVLMLSVN